MRNRRFQEREERFELPMQPTTPVDDWRRYSYLVYGKKKAGKTTFASRVKGTYIIQFDRPSKALSVMETVVRDWKTFRKILSSLERATKKFPYPLITVDGVDFMWRCCMTYVCKKLGIEHPADEGYGKGWDAVKTEFRDAINRLLDLPCGHIFICHEKTVEIENDEETIIRMVPGLSGSAEEIVCGKVDGWFLYQYQKDDRYLVLKGSETVDAGHGIEGHFCDSKGNFVRKLYMGQSAEEGFQNFVAAFHNKPIPHGKEVDRVKVKMKKR